jgi:hypothetical protein
MSGYRKTTFPAPSKIEAAGRNPWLAAERRPFVSDDNPAEGKLRPGSTDAHCRHGSWAPGE